MPTTRQKLVIGKLIANPSISLYKAMTSVGYAHATARAPMQNLGTGFLELAEQHLPDDFLLDALEQDIKNKPGKRHKELELALKVKGRLKSSDDGNGSGNTYNTFLQQNNINPNAKTAKELVDSSVDLLMNQTKREVIDHDTASN